MANNNSPGFLFGSIFQYFIFFANGYLFNLYFIVRNNAVQYRSNIEASFNLGHYLQHVVPVFQLHGSQSMPGPLTCYDGPLTMRKIPGTEGAAVGPLTFV